MRKVKALALAAVIIAAGAGMAGAAEQTGIGLQWGMGPAFMFGPFDQMKIADSFAIAWKVSEEVTVSIFRQGGMISGTHEYTDDITLIATGESFKRRITVDANYDINGMGISVRIPAISFLSVGMELGVISVGEIDTDFTNSNGSTGSETDFGGASSIDPLDGTGALEGLTAKVSLLKAETKTINSEIGIQAALRFVQLPTLHVFGIQESTVNKTLKKEIEPIHSLNSLDLRLVASLIF